MVARLKTGLWVKALFRRFNQESAVSMLLKRGDEDAGVLFIILTDPKNNSAILREQGETWQRQVFKHDDLLSPSQQVEAYLERQKHYDPDLWIIELNVPDCHAPVEKTLGSRYASMPGSF